MPSPRALLGALPFLSLLPSTLAVPEPGTIGFTFNKRRVDAQDAPRLRRRQSGTVQAGLTNEVLLYFINVTVGTPPQAFSLQLDTGSSDIWFPAQDADVCRESSDNCPFGTYDLDASDSAEDPRLPRFEIQYVDGTEISGEYVSDVLNIGDTQLTNMTMAAADRINSMGIGIMGIGFRSGEALAEQEDFTYPNVIEVLQSEGFTNSRTYSLWLDDLNSNTGSILFGGVDPDKFEGDLVALPIQLDGQSNSITSFTVAWTGLKVTGSDNNDDFSPPSPLPVILDSGTTDLLLPDDIANEIFNGVGVITDSQVGNVVPCSLANDDLTFTFTFGGDGGPQIAVPLSEFVTPLLTSDGSTPTFPDGRDACQFAIEAAAGNPLLFGDSFLRSAYVVYDLENQNVALAQTNFKAKNGNGGNVQAVSSGSADIPGVTSTATQASVQQSFTGNPHVTDDATATGDLGGGETSRSATFNGITATGSSGGSSSTSSGAASPNVRPSPVDMQALGVLGVAFAGMLFGGGLMLL